MLSPAQTTSADSRAAWKADVPRSATWRAVVMAIPSGDASPVRGIVNPAASSMEWERSGGAIGGPALRPSGRRHDGRVFDDPSLPTMKSLVQVGPSHDEVMRFVRLP